MRAIVFAALVIIGTLNREMTGVLLWLVYIAAYPERPQRWVLYGALVTVLVIGLRLVIPAIDSPYRIAYNWHLNTATWRTGGAILYLGLLAPVFILLAGWLPRRVGRMIAVVLIPYLMLYILLGVWQETRLLMPVIILLIPFSGVSNARP